MDFVLTCIEVGGFTVSTYFFFKVQKSQSELLEFLSYFQRSIVFSPDLLTKVLNHQAARYYINSIKNFEEGKEVSKGLAMVYGRVDCPKPIISFLNRSSKMVISTLTQENIFSNMAFGPLVYNKNYQKLKQMKDFVLIDAKNNLSQLSVAPKNSTRFNRALKLVQFNIKRRNMLIHEKLISWMLFSLKLVLSFSPLLSKKIKGVKLGFKRVERGIMVGQYIVAFGKISHNHKTGKTMMSPFLLMKNKDQFIKRLRWRAVNNSKIMNMLFCMMMLSSVLMGRRIKQFFVKIYKKIKLIREYKKMDKLLKVSELMVDDFKCIICCEIAKNIIFRPCLHMAICGICYQKLHEKKCPICNQKIEDIVTIYVS